MSVDEKSGKDEQLVKRERALRKRISYPDSESGSDDNEDDAIKKIRLCFKKSDSNSSYSDFSGGLTVISSSKASGSSVCASTTAAAKKGLREVEELERELDLTNTFSKETNRRDEDAEMSKFIEEQMRLRREASRRPNETNDQEPQKKPFDGISDLSEIFNSAASSGNLDDILLNSLSKNFSPESDEKNESMLSSQMLTGIPEVDLGFNERIRTIEATEEAKLKLATKDFKGSQKTSSYAPSNFSSNYQHHRFKRLTEVKKREKINVEQSSTVVEPVVVVGEEPASVEYKLSSSSDKQPSRGRATDDYHLSRFKKDMQNR